MKNEYKSQICIPPRKQYFLGNTDIFETTLHQSVSVIMPLVDQHVAVSLKEVWALVLDTACVGSNFLKTNKIKEEQEGKLQ